MTLTPKGPCRHTDARLRGRPSGQGSPGSSDPKQASLLSSNHARFKMGWGYVELSLPQVRGLRRRRRSMLSTPVCLGFCGTADCLLFATKPIPWKVPPEVGFRRSWPDLSESVTAFGNIVQQSGGLGSSTLHRSSMPHAILTASLHCSIHGFALCLCIASKRVSCAPDFQVPHSATVSGETSGRTPDVGVLEFDGASQVRGNAAKACFLGAFSSDGS